MDFYNYKYNINSVNFYKNYSKNTLTKKEKEGDPYSTYLLGMRYLCDKQYDLAFKFIKKSAELNVNESFYDLGMCYKLGEGIEPNMVNSYIFFKKAAEEINRDFRAFYELGLIYKKGILYNNDNDNYIVEKDLKKAYIYFEIALSKNNNNTSAILYELGLCYKNGDGVNKDEKKAFEYIQNSVNNEKLVKNQIELALCYKTGMGIEKDETHAIQIFRELITITQSICKCYCNNKKIIIENLIYYYENKKYISLSKIHNLASYYCMSGKYDKAFENYEISAYNKYAPSQYGLFWCYYKGKGVEKNIEVAIKWLQLSAKQDFEQAILMKNKLNL